MTIYDKLRMRIRTWTEGLNVLFDMGSELEGEVDGLKGGIVKDVTLTEVDKHYTLTILYDDNTSDTVAWDDSTVGIEDITLNYSDGVYILAIELTDGTRYTFSIPVGDIVTQQELAALNLGTPDDTASSTGSLWARVKDAVARIITNEGNISTLQTADTNNVKKTGYGTQSISGQLRLIPNGNLQVGIAGISGTPGSTEYAEAILLQNSDGTVNKAAIWLTNKTDGSDELYIRIKNPNGSTNEWQDYILTDRSETENPQTLATKNYVNKMNYVTRYANNTTTEVSTGATISGASVYISEPGIYDVKVYMQGTVDANSLSVIGYNVDNQDTWLSNSYSDRVDTWRVNGSWTVHITEPKYIYLRVYYSSPNNSTGTFANWIYATRVA